MEGRDGLRDFRIEGGKSWKRGVRGLERGWGYMWWGLREGRIGEVRVKGGLKRARA